MGERTRSAGAASPSNREPLTQYSKPVAPDAYEKNDEWFCRCAPRIHWDAHLADAGSWQCQIDFLEASSSARAAAKRNVANKSYAVGCMNPAVGNFTAVCAAEALPERLWISAYMIEYSYVHDDVTEYAENKSEVELQKTNQEPTKGLDLNGDLKKGTKDHVRRRQLQAKMAVELLEVDKDQGVECLRLWKEMSDVFVEIRDVDFKTIDEYLVLRAIDAGCR